MPWQDQYPGQPWREEPSGISKADKKLRDDKDIRSFYLGVATEGTARESFRDIKHYKRRKRWLS